MSDELSDLLYQVKDWKITKDENPDQKLIDALDKALKNTTPERPGCPWDKLEEEHERQQANWFLPEGKEW